MTRVLVVGCDPEHRRQLSGILESAGFAVSGVNGGEQVPAYARQVDAVIVDVASLGHRYGREVHRLLRTDARTAWLPILLVGWHTARLDLEAGLVGASYYLARPFTPTVLLSRLSHLIMHAAVATAALAGLVTPVQTGPVGAGGCPPPTGPPS
ncbi:MAG: two-component system, OmpR family, phosphate regulon response regulator PhoB [Mycobacteriales bacterium]